MFLDVSTIQGGFWVSSSIHFHIIILIMIIVMMMIIINIIIITILWWLVFDPFPVMGGLWRLWHVFSHASNHSPLIMTIIYHR